MLEYYKRSTDRGLQTFGRTSFQPSLADLIAVLSAFDTAVMPVLQAYTTAFGSKLCCVPDLKPYMQFWQADLSAPATVSNPARGLVLW